MNNAPALVTSTTRVPVTDGIKDMFVTMTVADQMFGIPVSKVQDVLGAQHIARVPLAPPEVLGSLNLRGRIVTAMDVRMRLGMPGLEDDTQSMNVVVEHDHELYSLAVDKVGDVQHLPASDFEPTPATLDPCWQDVCAGIYRMQGQCLVVLDVGRFLHDKQRAAL